jgi:hypothetical protein
VSRSTFKGSVLRPYVKRCVRHVLKVTLTAGPEGSTPPTSNAAIEQDPEPVPFHYLTNELTNCMGLIEKLSVAHLLRNLPTGSRSFFTVFTRDLNSSLSWAWLIQSIAPHHIYLRSVILSSQQRLRLPSELFPSSSPTKIQHVFLTRPATGFNERNKKIETIKW